MLKIKSYELECYLSDPSGLAVQHSVLSCGLLVVPRRSVPLHTSEGVSLQREGAQDGEGSPAACPRRNPNQQELQRCHVGQFVPAEEDHDVKTEILSFC